MLTITEFKMRVRVENQQLHRWVEAGWIIPVEQDGQPRYSELDVARAALIRDLQHELGVNAEGIDVILGLLDQLHGLRATVSDLMEALCAQPPSVREKLVADALRLKDSRRR
ncbi:chaperone modulator CbpM [Rhodoligotrophos defluvii]|uniref:chaperone modulator CbpM n=1 Tax=Rhodoligotrophos defluvii TaxID=2561934 RepID=UPI0010C99E45|nr:chaperone modulator CbpM [Rhodoligotrophos defluvii]